MAVEAYNRDSLLSGRGHGRQSASKQNYLKIVPRIEIIRSEPVIASKEEVQSAIDNDPLLSSEHRINFKYIELSQYKILEGQELELVQRLEVDMFEKLRRMGFVLFNPLTQRYFLMVGFDQDPIRDLITLIEKEANNINNGINRAASQNGLINGILDGKIRSISTYLRTNHYLNEESELTQALNGIYSFNLEFALNRSREETAVPVVEARAYNAVELEDEISAILESDQPLTNLVGIFNIAFANDSVRDAFFDDAIPRFGTEPRSRLLEFLELTELFKWSKHSIDNLDKVGALIPVVNEQISTLHVIRRELVEPLINFLSANPVWLNIWKEVINYVVNRIKGIAERLGGSISEEDANKIRHYLLKEIGNEFKERIPKTGKLTEI